MKISKSEIKETFWFVGIAMLLGIFTAFDVKSFWPIIFYPGMLLIFWLIYSMCSYIKSWRSKRSFDKLTQAQKDFIFRDIIGQSQWDSKARQSLHDSFRTDDTTDRQK